MPGVLIAAQVATIGSETGARQEIFGEIRDTAIGRRDRMYPLDSAHAEIRVRQESAGLLAETVVSSTDPDTSYLLTLTHEIVSDPRVDTTFNVPGALSIGSDGTLYYIDSGDRDIKVFSKDLEFQRSIGRRGQGPGEFDRPWLIDISPSGELFVYDYGLLAFHVFTLEGDFLYRAQNLGNQFFRQPKSFIVVDDDIVLVSAGALEEEMYEHAVHRFRLSSTDPSPQLLYEGSFGETVDYDPSLYRLIGGYLSVDFDGHLLYAQLNPYSLRKYSIQGELLWAVDDGEAMKPAHEYFVVSRFGRVGIRPYARSAMVAAYDDRYLLHVMMFPPFPDEREGTGHSRTIELVPRPGVEAERISFVIDRPWLYFDQRDQEGRLYGFWLTDDGTAVPIRSRMVVEKKPGTER